MLNFASEKKTFSQIPQLLILKFNNDTMYVYLRIICEISFVWRLSHTKYGTMTQKALLWSTTLARTTVYVGWGCGMLTPWISPLTHRAPKKCGTPSQSTHGIHLEKFHELQKHLRVRNQTCPFYVHLWIYVYCIFAD